MCRTPGQGIGTLCHRKLHIKGSITELAAMRTLHVKSKPLRMTILGRRKETKRDVSKAKSMSFSNCLDVGSSKHGGE